MGLAMASNLQRHIAAKKALSLVYSNRTLSRGDSLKDLGGVPEKSFEGVVEKSGIIFTMVNPPSPSQCRYVCTELKQWGFKPRYPTTPSSPT